ncbi:hypothetical protein K438DRAFT_2001499 [Mycena galopus ATCC 62051]|nr:hypothetical protein K438DRAFT_2001499 [Mycena galopus ATCC 62051]
MSASIPTLVSQPPTSGANGSAPTVPSEFDLLGHARINDTIWSVYQGNYRQLRDMPDPQTAPPPSTSEIKKSKLNFWRPSYVSPETPQIMFIPDCFFAYGYFSFLNYKRHTLDIVQIILEDEREADPDRALKIRYCLNKDLKAEWSAKEKEIRLLLNVMWDMIMLPRPEPMRYFPWPYQFCYDAAPSRTEAAARTVAWRSLHAFLPLIGHLAMSFMYMRASPDYPDWQERICAKMGEKWGYRTFDGHDTFAPTLAALLDSVAGREDTRCIGGIIDFSVPPKVHPDDVKMPRFLDFVVGTIIRKNLPIPLYIGWGPITAYPHVFVPRSFRSLQFVPEQIEIQYLQSLPGSVAFSRWNRSKNNIFWSLRDSEPYTPLSPSPPPAVPAGPLPAIASYTPSSPLPAPAGPFPSVELYSGQRPGEAMEHFFAGRQQKNEATEARETPQERKSREQRAANAASGEVPGRKGARVYVWEKSSRHFIRTAGGRTRYEDLWEEYGPSQRKYDSFHNEWDLCETFGPSGGDREDYEWDYDPEDMGLATPAFVPEVNNDDDDDDPDAPTELLPERVRLKVSATYFPSVRFNSGGYDSLSDTQSVSLNSHNVQQNHIILSMFVEPWGSDAWLRQANHIFHCLGIVSNFENYVFVAKVLFNLKLSPSDEEIPTGFLFLCPKVDFQTCPASFCWPHVPAYWSLDPFGADRLTPAKLTHLGFPLFKLTTEIRRHYWDPSVYNGLRKFHQAKGFDPESQDVALHIGYPLYRLSSEVNKEDYWDGVYGYHQSGDYLWALFTESMGKCSPTNLDFTLDSPNS